MENQDLKFFVECNEIKNGIISLYPDAIVQNRNSKASIIYNIIEVTISDLVEDNKYNLSFSRFSENEEDKWEDENIGVQLVDTTIEEVIDFIKETPPDKILNYFN